MRTFKVTSNRIHTAVKKLAKGDLKDGRGTKSGETNHTSQVQS